MTLQLGKTPATHDHRDLTFAKYRDPEVKLPKVFGYGKLIDSWEMLGNGPDPEMPADFEGAGDCVWAMAAHTTMLRSRAAGTGPNGGPIPFTTRGVLNDYSKATGYNPVTGANDNGTDMRVALKYRQKTGIIDANGKRHKIGAYVALEPGNLTQMLEALYYFGATEIGIEFPSYAMDQFNQHKPWAVKTGGQIEGGHAIPIVLNPYQVVTWARLQPVTAGFLTKFCDEAWAVISPEFLKAGKAPNGFDLAQLQTDLANLQVA